MTVLQFPTVTSRLLARKGEARPADDMVVRSSTGYTAPVRATRQIGFSPSAIRTTKLGAARSRHGAKAPQVAAYVGAPRATLAGLIERGMFGAPHGSAGKVVPLHNAFDRITGPATFANDD